MIHHWLPLVTILLTWLPPEVGAVILDPNFSDMTIECDPSGVILTVNGTALKESIPGIDPKSLRIGDGPWLDDCRPRRDIEGGRGIRTFKFAYGDCHPHAEEITNTKLKLTFDVVGDVSDRADDSPEGAAVSCFIPKDGLIGAHIESDSNTYTYAGSSEGPFQFGITIYKDAFMTNPVQKDEEIHLGMPMWVGVKLNSSSNAEMFVRDCWATPTHENSAEQPEHVFIKNGIIGEDDETFSPVDDVITARTYGFMFDSFMFRGSGSRVFIKCHIHVCDPWVTDADQAACSIPKYPEYHMSLRSDVIVGSGSGSGFGINLRDVGEEEVGGGEADDNDEFIDTGGDEDEDGGFDGRTAEEESQLGDATGGTAEVRIDTREIEQREAREEHPVYYVMNSFTVKHVERKRRSAGSYRIYPRHTIFSNFRSGIMLGIIIASTAMFSACAILLPLHLSGEKVRCLHVKPVKRVV